MSVLISTLGAPKDDRPETRSVWACVKSTWGYVETIVMDRLSSQEPSRLPSQNALHTPPARFHKPYATKASVERLNRTLD